MRIETGAVVLFVATKKGLWILRSDGERRGWSIEGPVFLGHIVNHARLDPRDRRTLLLAARTGHLVPTIFRSTDLGKSWKEASRLTGLAREILELPGKRRAAAKKKAKTKARPARLSA